MYNNIYILKRKKHVYIQWLGIIILHGLTKLSPFFLFSRQDYDHAFVLSIDYLINLLKIFVFSCQMHLFIN
jgi:hypothetical protein